MKPGALQFAETRDLDAWDAAAGRSPQGTVFCSSAFLRCLGAPFRLFTVQDSCAIVAQVPIIEDAQGNAVRFPFTPYLGILFLHDAARASQRRRLLDEFRITEFLIGKLTARYRRIGMALCWNFRDLRPFLWHNHGVEAAPRFVATPRYTALLDLERLDPVLYPADVQACRRQELRNASRFEVTEQRDIDSFLQLYADTFARQGMALDASLTKLVRNITCGAILGGWGRLSACVSDEGIGSMNLFVYDRRRAYYLFAANNPALRNTGASTRLMFDNICHASLLGLKELDFVGVNSPARGNFKLSFNPQLRLYFELDYKA